MCGKKNLRKLEPPSWPSKQPWSPKTYFLFILTRQSSCLLLVFTSHQYQYCMPEEIGKDNTASHGTLVTAPKKHLFINLVRYAPFRESPRALRHKKKVMCANLAKVNVCPDTRKNTTLVIWGLYYPKPQWLYNTFCCPANCIYTRRLFILVDAGNTHVTQA